jgi:FemAB-related protein (PEP-CTERM system-associated)
MADVRLLDASGREEWNRFVSMADNASPYHRFEWLLAVETAYGHKPYPLAAFEGAEVVAILPLVLMEQPLTRKGALVSLPFCDLGGMIGPEAHASLLKEKALELAHQTNAQVLEIRHRSLEGLGYDFDRLSNELGTQKVSMLLELESSGDDQLAAFKPKLRSQIKKAMKNGCTTKLGNSQQLIDDFYTVFSRNMHALGSPVHSKALFHAIAQDYGDNAVIGVVYFEGQVAAAGIILKNGANAVIPWASSLVEYNRLAPNMLLYWELLAQCADNGIRVFDFGRSSFGEGTFRFKKQWGAQPYLLTWQNWLDQSVTLSSSPGRVRRLVENAWRRLPLSIVNLLGPLIRKHIRL